MEGRTLPKAEAGEALDRTCQPEAIKVVGGRLPPKGDWEDARRLLRTAAKLRRAEGLVPRGVYRFATFEEADEWLRRTIARTLGHRRSRISSGSLAR